MSEHVRRSLIAFFALGAIASLVMAFAPAALWTELFGLI
jgi:hypothetical protein